MVLHRVLFAIKPWCYTDTKRECVMSKNPLCKETSSTKEVNYLARTSALRQLFVGYSPDTSLGAYGPRDISGEEPAFSVIRDLKQTRTATAGNKQLNFTVKHKPHTTNYIYCIFKEYFIIKSV